MAFRGIPFDSKMVLDNSGTYEDRQVFSEDIAKYFGFVSSDGICLKDDEELTNQLLVEAGTDSEIILNPGTIKIQGRMGWITEPESLFANPGGSLPRIDSAVIELNLSVSVRGFVFKIVEGEESSNPEPPTLVRTSDVWQLGLGNFYRPANSTLLGEFTDTRLDSERCGVSKVATPNIGVDTLTLWQENYPEITNLNDILYLIGSEGLPEEFGGTHSKSLPEARQNINFIGVDPISSFDDDTVENWMELGTGIVYVSEGILKHPSITVASILKNNVVEVNGHKFISQTLYVLSSSATVLHRSGNENGWYSNGIWVETLNENNGVQMELLWKNASPTSSFAGQTIETGVTGMDYQYIMAVFSINADGRKLVSFSPINWYGEIQWIGNMTNTLAMMYFRRTWTLGNSGNFITESCITKQSNQTDTNNNYLIPYEVYGIKGVQ